MLKILAKVAEKYAKSTNSACWIWGINFNKEGLVIFLVSKKFSDKKF